MNDPSSIDAAAHEGIAPEAAKAEPVFVAWAQSHQRDSRRHEAELAQITEHPDAGAEQDAIGQQQAWARRQEHEKHLHDSAIAQIRRP